MSLVRCAISKKAQYDGLLNSLRFRAGEYFTTEIYGYGTYLHTKSLIIL